LQKCYQRLAISAEAQLESLLLEPNLKGVAASAPTSLLQWLERILAQRQGALTPLIVETNGPALLHRFFVETVVSNNITASGGNTALLTMSDG